MDSVCSYTVYNPNEGKSYKVVWDGANPGISGCRISFKGRDTNDLTKTYTVCVEAKEFSLQSTGIRLQYRTGFSSASNTVFVFAADRVRHLFKNVHEILHAFNKYMVPSRPHQKSIIL